MFQADGVQERKVCMKVRKVWFTAAAIAGLAALTLSGCTKKEKDYDVYFFNAKSEIAESLEQLSQEYENETGKRVKVFTVGTTEGSETLRSELKSRDYPTVFASNAVAFEEWKSAGFAAGAEELQTQELKELYESVPDTMRLQFEGEGNYGIPYNIEGYGLIADQRMLVEILDIKDLDGFMEDYKNADYTQFQAMVEALDQYIKGGKSVSFTLDEREYHTKETKTELTNQLNGVFSIAGAEKWTYGNHYGNYPVSAVYKDVYDVRESSPDKADNLKEVLKKSLDELEFISNFASGPNGSLKRGPEFINSTVTGYDQAVQSFSEGKAIFIKNGNWIYGNVEKIVKEKADNLIMLPVKVNFSDEDIMVEGMTVDKMNRSIPEFVSQYYIINVKATMEERKEAEEFVLWLNTSETGKNYIINEFAFVPFNADEKTVLSNPLSNALITYKTEDNLLANPFDAWPASWGIECYGKYIMEELFTNPEKWSDEKMEEIAAKCVKYWKSGMEEW